MNYRDVIAFTARSVTAHRLRSALTALGIGIGVAAVVLLTSMGEGLNQYMLTQFSQFGTHMVVIAPGRPATFGLSPGILNTVRPLTIEDGQALARLPYVKAWIPNRAGISEVEANRRVRSTMVLGTGSQLPAVFEMEMAMGTFLPDDDPISPRPLAVIGSKIRDEMYGNDNPLGDRIRIGGSRFRIVGVLAPKGEIVGFNMDDLVMIPAARALALYNHEGLTEIDLVYPETADVDEVVAGVRRVLLARHGVEDFNLMTQQQMLDVLGNVLDVVTMAVAALGSISLLVGGVGIFTIMTIAVRERMHEIGLLRAIGSSREQVLKLFLSESVVLATLGGVFGLALGIALVSLLRAGFPALPLNLSLPYIIAAEAVAAGIGLIAGVAPANHAARLDPLEALRAE